MNETLSGQMVKKYRTEKYNVLKPRKISDDTEYQMAISAKKKFYAIIDKLIKLNTVFDNDIADLEELEEYVKNTYVVTSDIIDNITKASQLVKENFYIDGKSPGESSFKEAINFKVKFDDMRDKVTKEIETRISEIENSKGEIKNLKKEIEGEIAALNQKIRQALNNLK